tara:strand:- start:41580 stop:42764 length:1185 start_codon:yes stop_codon:yes gene_type:complete
MIADRVSRIQPSFTLEMTAKAADLRNKGIDVIDLGVGEPDFNTPENIRQKAKEAMDSGFTKYTPGSGLLELKKAICLKLKRDNDLDYEPSNIIASNGAKHSLSTACQVLFNPGDEVIIFAPYWVSFPEFVRLADAEPVIVNTLPEKNFDPDFSDLKVKISEKTKGMIINSPSNPTGSVWDKSIQLKLIDVAHKHGLVILSDECYESLVYDKSFISTEKLNNKGVTILTIQSLSKTYAMTGWRIGYTAGDPKIVKAMGKIQGQATSCPNSIGQKAAIEALTGDQKKVSEMQEIFRKRRIIMIEKLNKIPHITCPIPGGAFYAFPNVEHYLNKSFNGKKMSTSFDLCDYILDYAKTVSVAGSGFGMDGHIRLSYATNEETFLEGLNKIEKSLSQLN